MRYFWYGFLGLFSLGFLGLMAAIIGVVGIFYYYSYDLPDYKTLENYEPPIVTRLYAGDGRLLAEFARERRIFVPIESIPPMVKNAFIAVEDKKFYSHHGVDYRAIARAILTNIKALGTGGRPQGASTITQQIAKNFLLSNEVSYKRKIREAIISNRIEDVMSKDRILELYLNEIYLGGGAYGVAAAALYYFDKALDDLSVAEVAYLASLPKAPNNYHPLRNHKKAVIRRNASIGRMEEEGYITAAEAELARLAPLEMVERNDDEEVDAPFFAEEVRRELAEQYNEEGLYEGGLVVRTSVDPKLQSIATQALRDGLTAYDMRHGYRGPLDRFSTLMDWRRQLQAYPTPPKMIDAWDIAVVLKVSAQSAKLGFAKKPQGQLSLEKSKWARAYKDEGYAKGPEITSLKQVVKAGDIILVEQVDPEAKVDKDRQYALRQFPDIQGAIIALDPHTGRILAMQGGWKYEYGQSEFNRATQAQRQPGSAFKPFVYMAGLDKGFTPATLVLDAPFVIEDRPGNFWKPTNYTNEFYGPTPLRVGLEKSKNLMTVRLADFIGMETIAEYAERFGITKDMPPLLSFSLGAGETTLYKLTAAYSVFVNGGKKITPTFIDRIQDRDGDTIFKHDRRTCENCGPKIRWEKQGTPNVPDTRAQIADPRTAYQMVSMLEGVVQRGTGVRLRALGYPLAGKTGTTNKSKDTWFIGFSPDMVVGVFMGFDDPRSLGKRETGSSVALPVFKDFMAQALADKPPVPFRIPEGIRNVRINAETGARAKPGDERTIWEGFIIGTEPTDEILMLDGQGVNVVPNIKNTNGGDAITGTGGLY